MRGGLPNPLVQMMPVIVFNEDVTLAFAHTDCQTRNFRNPSALGFADTRQSTWPAQSSEHACNLGSAAGHQAERTGHVQGISIAARGKLV